ncbi:ribonuclease Z [Streptosporangium algeriense]|uniref:Ribonuclease Z n=1 Tax=Streptosporangium algeriense TaxID=1682748 RepID=A0ABW3DLM1_9ACTN
MSTRELVVLGTASAVPTKERNHNGYLLRWDGASLLFDPGEGTQRQMVKAGVSAHEVDWICLTHFHGDHCLGVPGVLGAIARRGGVRQVEVVFPADGSGYWEHLRRPAATTNVPVVREHLLSGEHVMLDTYGAPFRLSARRLSHSVESYGYRLEEPDSFTLLPDALAAHGVQGPLAGRLREEGRVVAPDGGTVTLAECAVPRRGQKVAFIMDTRPCDAVDELADGVDLLIIEATYLNEQADLAWEYGHLTAGQAGQTAARAGARRLVMTHFSERYRTADEPRFLLQAAYGGDVVLAHDLIRVPVPPRQRAHLASAR